MLLADKVALITGGAGLNGLGFATARMLAAQGARVVDPGPGTRRPGRRAAKLGPQHLGLVADVTDKASCERAAKAAVEQCGRIDILVNNAGITQPRKTVDITGADYDAVLDVSLRGTLLHVAGRAAGDARGQVAAPSSASRRSRRNAAAASSAARTTRRPRPACWAWRVRWRANSASTASASIASRRA